MEKEGGGGKTPVRISKSILPPGNKLALMTDLPDTIAIGELADLYDQRWEIEKKYHTLKNKMKFECVTGKASVYVYQDFWAQVLVSNMVQDIRNNADGEVTAVGGKKEINISCARMKIWQLVFSKSIC